MNDHAARKSACRREMGNNEFSRSGLIVHKRMSVLCFEGLMNILWCYSYYYVGGIILSVL